MKFCVSDGIHSSILPRFNLGLKEKSQDPDTKVNRRFRENESMPIGDTWFAYLVFAVALVMTILLRNPRVQAEFGSEKISRVWKIVFIFFVYSGFDLIQNLVVGG